MKWWEVNRFVMGIQRRYRSQYDTMRTLQWTLSCMFHDKKQGAAPSHPRDLYLFPWEKDDPNPPELITDEEREMLRKICIGRKWVPSKRTAKKDER